MRRCQESDINSGQTERGVCADPQGEEEGERGGFNGAGGRRQGQSGDLGR
ncbi:hypothetical protein LSTR_LSTR002079 [Laodelphax striatellus]|uniref:Uncharacterized protein n=1 Tax=Laodelphax striatellus TaxID=195883 RepID=A0A482XPW5_LAOST|nr:hypothetical protein LSTR_LSTR002079 [Laodelphax striatellus]